MNLRVLAASSVLLAALLAGCTSSADDDDGDGLTRAQEEQGWEIIIDLVGKRIGRHVTSDPTLQDTDGDGVLDHEEFALSLDPRSKDTDQDGLSDCQEVKHTNRSQCEDPQWEGLTDGGYGTIGNNADSDGFPSRYMRWHFGEYVDETGTLPDQVTWGDGISDGAEIEGYEVHLPGGRTRIVTTDPLKTDSDEDYLEDGEERFIYDTDPEVQDTDGDGCFDGLDPFPLFEERFDIGLESITWEPEGGSGSIDAQLLLHIADNGFNHPPASGLTLQHGEPHDLSQEDLPTWTQAHCSFPPWHPWLQVSVQVREIIDGEPGPALDFDSDDVPNDVGLVWWDAREDRFHFSARSRDSTDFSQAFRPPGGQIVWSGADGTLVFDPVVVKSPNHNP